MERVLPIGNYDGKLFKTGLPFNFGGQVLIKYEDNDVASANTNHTIETVPNDEIWVLNNISIEFVGSSASYIGIYLRDNSINYTIVQQSNPTNLQQYVFAGQIVLLGGQILYGSLIGATIGDNFQAEIIGYKLAMDNS